MLEAKSFSIVGTVRLFLTAFITRVKQRIADPVLTRVNTTHSAFVSHLVYGSTGLGESPDAGFPSIWKLAILSRSAK